MTAHYDEEHFLPREHLDLPTPHETLPPHAQDSMHEVKTFLSWHAPGRPFRKKKKEYFVNIILIALAIMVILFLFSQYLLMLVVASLVFLSYALNTVAPHDFRYKITSEGIRIEDHAFLWEELYDFYFKRVDGIDVLHIRTRAYFPGELTLTLGDIHMEQIKSVLLPYLPFREVVNQTFLEKAGDWLSKTFPLERLSS